ncbi:hypothetical protein CDAR_235521, partial [Caerostris darwini]
FSNSVPRFLQFVPVSIINNKVCETWHRKQGINIRIHDEMMCAGYEYGGKDACQVIRWTFDDGRPKCVVPYRNRVCWIFVRQAVPTWHLPQGVQLSRLGVLRLALN